MPFLERQYFLEIQISYHKLLMITSFGQKMVYVKTYLKFLHISPITYIYSAIILKRVPFAN